MRKSYVGIATPQGLEVFVPENRHVGRFLMRRAYRSGTFSSVCFWAVMEEAIASTVLTLLYSGRRQDALLIIQTLATETGSFFPEEQESPVFFAG
ncbi:hypothetical protein GC176_27345 [bacterium]|nr:hypothetical protein [bacterium]